VLSHSGRTEEKTGRYRQNGGRTACLRAAATASAAAAAAANDDAASTAATSDGVGDQLAADQVENR